MAEYEVDEFDGSPPTPRHEPWKTNPHARKQREAEKKAEEIVAEQKARADAKAAVIKAEAEAQVAIEKAENESREAVLKAEKEAKEAVDKAERDAKASIDMALAIKDNKTKPIKFKDAVGRKFSFPFHICATWVVGTVFHLLLWQMLTGNLGHGRVDKTRFPQSQHNWSPRP